VFGVNQDKIRQDSGRVRVRMILDTANDEIWVLGMNSEVGETGHWIDYRTLVGICRL
jgi:hypothetical protein